MKIRQALLSALSCFALASLPITLAKADTVARSGTISFLIIDTRPCIFFALDGVPEASPQVPGQIWIAIPKATPNFSEIYAALLSAKFSKQSVTIYVNGSSTCDGYATTAGINVSQS